MILGFWLDTLRSYVYSSFEFNTVWTNFLLINVLLFCIKSGFGFYDFLEITFITAIMTGENQVDVKDEVAEVSYLHYKKDW